MKNGENINSRRQLLKKLNEVSFAVDDLLLYLDTHPTDPKALELFTQVSSRRNHLLKEYSSLYGPLTIDSATDSDLSTWQWAQQPFPWEQEGGCR